MRRFYLNGKSITQTRRDFRIQFVARYGAIPGRNTILRWIKNVNTAGSLMKKPPRHAKTDRMPENVERVRIATVHSSNRSLKRRAESVGISASSVRRILMKDLQFHPYKIAVCLWTFSGKHFREK
ncbi:hypothetical protein C0J52_15862 [Blattella germanica]|nr:hypothetical protein C0J52_15862 [Blattella germanica]